MEDQQMVVQPTPQRNKNKLWIVLLCVVLAVVVVGGCIWFATADWRQYQKGVLLTELKQYDAALEIFTELRDYSNAQVLALQVRYEMAAQTSDEGDILEAAKQFEALGDYEDSRQRVLACYYAHAAVKRAEKEYDTAIQYFLLAKDYQDAPTQHQMACYEAGHSAFLQGSFDDADTYFSMLDGDITEYGVRHFITIDDAAGFLDEQRTAGAEEIRFCLAQYDEDDVIKSVKNYLSGFYDQYFFLKSEHIVTVQVTSYYPGDKILNAHRTGDISALSEAEKQTYQLALELVEQAKTVSATQLDVELWLHDWLCEHVIYENPDMEVPAEQFIALRQLTCVGALLDGKANCQGYTDAFYLLGNLAGFEVRRLFGVAEEGHCWNIVKLDGLWYIVDVTFDDNEAMAAWQYLYFNTPWDPDTYEIYGGPEVQPDLATKDSDEYSYYHAKELYYSDYQKGVKAVFGKVSGGTGKVATVKIEGIHSVDKVISGIKWHLSNHYAGSGVINCLCLEYNGDTYVFAKYTRD
jgi:tetratricopeptide (TPR) repeat protein